MKAQYATFDCSLPSDEQEIGNRFIQPGNNVASRVRDGLKSGGHPVTDVADEESYGWYFLVGPLGLFKRKPCVYCLFQSGGEENKWLLIVEEMRGFFVFGDEVFHRRILDDIEAILRADGVFSNLTPWITAKEYEQAGRGK